MKTGPSAEEAGFEPAADITASDRFQGGSDRPLRHPSMASLVGRAEESLPPEASATKNAVAAHGADAPH